VVWLRAGVYLGRMLGTTARTFRPRPWERIDLATIARRGTPASPAEYAQFKREHAPEFLFPLGRPPEVPPGIRDGRLERQPPLRERLGLLAQDRCVYFFRRPSPTAIDWHANPFDGRRSASEATWCRIPDYLPGQGDPRTLWEPSRAAWAIDVARARAHGLEGDWGPLFWRWVNSWMTACPPFLGFQWKCGQESSVRFIAIALGFWSLAYDRATTPERWVQFARLAWATGYRVQHHIKYALSQKNNHALSEACGLLLISHLFPELRASADWHALGRRVLGRELRRQVYSDGSYLQHSMNYHRVMLHTSLLGLRLGELSGKPFEPDLYDRLQRCAYFVYQMMEPDTGRLPNYGNNDGAYVMPLSECDFADFRPVVQAVYYLSQRRRLFPTGPWDEDLLWLFGSEACVAEVVPPEPPASTAFEVGGYYTLRREQSWAMIRCHTYRDRPGQCDPVHVDLWWRGQNVLQDCGTYQYYLPGRPDVEHYFKSVAAHNTVTVDGVDPANHVSRFLWFPWLRARKRQFGQAAGATWWFEGEHYGYDRAPWGVVHRRTVISLADDLWVVVDDLLGSGRHELILRWHMMDAPYEAEAGRSCLRLQTPAGDVFLSVTGCPAELVRFEAVRGRDEPGRVQGFAAPYYGERLPIPTLEVTCRCPLPQRIVTAVSPVEPLVVRAAEPGTESERWGLVWGDRRWIVELARLQRVAPRTFLGCAAAASGSKLTDL